MVAGGLAYHVFDGIAEQGRGYGDVGYEAVVDGAFGQQSVGKKAEQGTVGVAANDVDGINQTGGIDGLEQQDEQQTFDMIILLQLHRFYMPFQMK